MAAVRTFSVAAANAILYLPFILIWNGATHSANPVKFHVDTWFPVNQLVSMGLLAALAAIPALQVRGLRDEVLFTPDRRVVSRHAIHSIVLGLLLSAILFTVINTVVPYNTGIGTYVFIVGSIAGGGIIYASLHPKTPKVVEEEWEPEGTIELSVSTKEDNPMTLPSFVEFIEDTGTTFADLIGLEDAKQELLLSLDIIRNQENADKFGVKPIKGILLHGPPGTGKTKFAKAAAAETGLPFLRLITSELVHHHIGQTEKNIRAAFEIARAHAPCLVFADEIETLVGDRKNSQHSWEQAHTNAFLQELDGITGGKNAPIFLGATNNKDAIDPAVLRDGRLERHILVGIPDADGRKALFELFTRNKVIDPALDFGFLATQTEGFSPASIEGVCNDVARAIYLESHKTGATEPRPATAADFLKIIQRRQ